MATSWRLGLSFCLALLAGCSRTSSKVEIEHLEQVSDLPSWILEELQMNVERGVMAFARFYESSVRRNQSSCNRLKLSVVTGKVRDWSSVAFERQFGAQMDAAIRIASLLSSLFQTRRMLDDFGSSASFTNAPGTVPLPHGCGSLCDDAYYYTLARSFVESDERVLGFGVAFATHEYIRKSSTVGLGERVFEFYPYAYRNITDRGHIIVLEASRFLRYSLVSGQYGGTDWYNELTPPFRSYTNLFRRVNQSLLTFQTIGEAQYIVKPDAVAFASREDARWSVPYFDCKLTETWKITYSVPFFDSNENFKGVVTLDIALDAVDVDQCGNANEVPLFGGSHKCKLETTDCVPLRGRGFRLGAYECRCRPGFYCLHTPPSTPLPATPINITNSDSGTETETEPDNRNGTAKRDLPPNSMVWSWFDTVTNQIKTQKPQLPTELVGVGGNLSSTETPVVVAMALPTVNYFAGPFVESAFRDMQWAHMFGGRPVAEYDVAFQCLPCKLGCDTCVDDTPCLAESNMLLRGVPLAFQSFFITICCLVAFLVLQLRYAKLMRSSTWLLHELILAGGVLMYFTVVIMYFEASLATCMTLPWFRQLGFSLIYGSILLRLYRILVENQSRNARRVHLADRDMLKYIAAIVAITGGYMLIWTSVNVDQFSTAKLLQVGNDGVSKYLVCKACWWDYLIELGELLFVIACIYLCYCVRACPTECNEVRLITVAVCNEALISGVFHLSRHFVWLTAHPDSLFLAYFVHCHLTVTFTLCLVVGSRVWFAHVQAATCAQRSTLVDDPRGSVGSAGALLQPAVHATGARSGSTTLALASAGIGACNSSGNGELENGDVNLSEMDADEVRAELRRVYSQLQAYRQKAMRNENPHMVKRGRNTKTDRRTSAEPQSRRGTSRTPEDSTLSDRPAAD